eukprot:248011-Rhodomonas_salina.2
MSSDVTLFARSGRCASNFARNLLIPRIFLLQGMQSRKADMRGLGHGIRTSFVLRVSCDQEFGCCRTVLRVGFCLKSDTVCEVVYYSFQLCTAGYLQNVIELFGTPRYISSKTDALMGTLGRAAGAATSFFLATLAALCCLLAKNLEIFDVTPGRRNVWAKERIASGMLRVASTPVERTFHAKDNKENEKIPTSRDAWAATHDPTTRSQPVIFIRTRLKTRAVPIGFPGKSLARTSLAIPLWERAVGCMLKDEL